MSTYQLGELVLEPGVRFTHFFNGRLLSGEALTQERVAYLSRDRQLGQALGSGIAEGLEVTLSAAGTKTAPILSISAGLGVAPSGHTLLMESAVNLGVVTPPPIDSSADTDDFTDCTPLPSSVYVNGSGYYLLTVAPAEGKEGSAPVSGLGNGLSPCNAKYVAQGLQFRLLPLAVAAPSSPSRARNEIAYQCFKVTAASLASRFANPFSKTFTNENPLGSLVPGGLLTECDLPLAVLEWKADGIGFLDMWSVRRRLTRSFSSGAFGDWLSDRDLANQESMFQQFQNHISELQAGTESLSTATLSNWFRWLPPAGFLPLALSAFPRGFDYQQFFSPLSVSTAFHIEGRRGPHILRDSFAYPPIDTLAGELVWIYFVRENEQAAFGGPTPRPQPYVLFASGNMKFEGEPRFNAAHWNYANYV